jgi:hypothetical protein
MNILKYINNLPLSDAIKTRIKEETFHDKGQDYMMQERTEFEMKDFPFCALFVWNKTPEGFDYWSDINNTLLDR